MVGLARSGCAAATLLARRGERVIGVDRVPVERPALAAAGIEVHAGDGVELLERVRAVVKSPGVPREAPVIATARALGMPVLGELELAWRLLPNELLAVTGTNGKTTTVELLGHIHRIAGIEVAVAGNVGAPLAGLVGQLADDALIVCEASSFQLEDTLAFAPRGAVLLNLAEDHLDRHGTIDAYLDAKLAIFARQGPEDIAVLPLAGPVARPPGRARVIRFGADRQAELAIAGDALLWEGAPLIEARELRLPGAHNLENAAAAAALALARGVDAGAVRDGLRSFAGVRHRLEEVGVVDGVAYVNDSKATNVASAIVALRCFPAHSVHLIAGGQGKGQDFTPLGAAAAERARAVYLIGEDAPAIAAAIAPAEVALHHCGTLERALASAHGVARRGETVLLAPACASFDQFASFEERGDAFRDLVAALKA